MRKKMKKQHREKETYQNWSVLVSFFHVGDWKFTWNLLSETGFCGQSSFVVKPIKCCLCVSTYPWPALFFSTSLLEFVWSGPASSGRDRSWSTKPAPPPVERRCSGSPLLCLFMMRVGGAIKPAGWKPQSFLFPTVFLSEDFFFSSPKDDASFQGVFNLQTVSSVYFTAVKCVPSRSYLSLLKPILSFAPLLVATQKNKRDL